MSTYKKVPVILQMEGVECGAASLAMVLAYYKRYIPLEQMRIDCNVNRDGSSAQYIVRAAKKHGMDAKAFRMTPEAIREHTDFPVIIHWNFNHFVVLCGFHKGDAVINDPASGRIFVSAEAFDTSFTGIVLDFSPGEDFQPCGKEKNSWSFVRQRMRGFGVPFIFVITMGVIYGVMEMFSPVFYRIFTDDILLGTARDWFRPLIFAMIVVGVMMLITGSLWRHFLAKMKARMIVRDSARFIWKLLRMPIPFYSQRSSGDIVSRTSANQEFAELLFESVIPVAVDMVTMVLLFGIMIYYDCTMALIGVAGGILNIGSILILSRNTANAARNMQRDEGKLAGTMISSIAMMETIKSSGAEHAMLERLLGYQTKYNNSDLEVDRQKTRLSILPGLLSGLCNAFILIFGIYAVFDGRMTLGILVGFQGFVNLFFNPMESIAAAIQSIREVDGNVNRIQDVMEYGGEVTEERILETDPDQRAKDSLSGQVEMRHVNFRYSPVTPMLIEDFQVQVKPGQMIAFVGGSGSGKSTLVKLLSGLYEPVEGEILFDGKTISEIDHYVFRNSISVVDQSISLFSGTIFDNITMWDDSISEEAVLQACKDACIHEDIMMRKGGYQYVIQEGGSDFSGGQRQRIEIARAFVSNPSVLMLDEATSALDVFTEKKILEAVRKKNITCFVVAHRLSTIRDADEIFMMEYGKVVERGTHRQLMELDGAYARLVNSD